MIKFIKKIFNRNKKFENLKKAIAETKKERWRQRALEMFVFPHTDEGYAIRGKKCLRQEAIESFEKYSGYTLNELGVKHD